MGAKPVGSKTCACFFPLRHPQEITSTCNAQHMHILLEFGCQYLTQFARPSIPVAPHNSEVWLCQQSRCDLHNAAHSKTYSTHSHKQVINCSQVFDFFISHILSVLFQQSQLQVNHTFCLDFYNHEKNVLRRWPVSHFPYTTPLQIAGHSQVTRSPVTV